MKPARRKVVRPKKNAADRDRAPTRRAVRAELYRPENLEKARRLDRGPIV
ncbi:MAG: hypothetical protein LBK76_01740 [Verrucomicrobiales bacterium]|nr:hypothetical protein [Verrucomicrobiales bacterium]